MQCWSSAGNAADIADTHSAAQNPTPNILAHEHLCHLVQVAMLQDQLEHFQELAHTEQMEAYAAVQQWAAAAQAAQQVPLWLQQHSLHMYSPETGPPMPRRRSRCHSRQLRLHAHWDVRPSDRAILILGWRQSHASSYAPRPGSLRPLAGAAGPNGAFVAQACTRPQLLTWCFTGGHLTYFLLMHHCRPSRRRGCRRRLTLLPCHCRQRTLPKSL